MSNYFAALSVCAVIVATGTWWTVGDYLDWLNMGTGGTPPTFRGYVKIRRWDLYRFFKNDDLRDPSPLSSQGQEYLNRPLPSRRGGHATLMPRCLPQRQTLEHIDGTARARLFSLMKETFEAHPKLLNYGPSKTEGGSTDAIFVKPDLSTCNPKCAVAAFELAHVHPTDNSLHVHVSPPDARKIIQAEWGQRFPAPWLTAGTTSWIMVYAPRTEDEVEVIFDIIKASVGWGTGISV